MRVLKQKSNRIYFLVVLISVTTTLSLTSWMNVDALVIPKVIIVFCSAMFLFPLVLFNVRFFFTHLRLRILFFLFFCMLIQMIIVMFISSAPIEQQIFGKTGRGLGFLTEISILIITLITIRYVELKNLHYLVNGLVFSVCISSVYSIFQSFGLDLFAWYSRTNGIIGTLGNPNFQSAIAAISIVPASTYIWQKGFKPKFLSFITCLTLIYTIYICQSSQGYIVATLTILVSLLLYLWYRSRVFFYITSISAVIAGFISLAGMLNIGPLSGFLYKQSVSSRGEFFRTAVYGANDNPFFGVGLDSFGDFSQFYKSAKDYAGINEFTDNAHNYFLQYAVTGGYPLAVFYLFLTLLT